MLCVSWADLTEAQRHVAVQQARLQLEADLLNHPEYSVGLEIDPLAPEMKPC